MTIEIEGDDNDYSGNLTPSAQRVKAFLDSIPPDRSESAR